MDAGADGVARIIERFHERHGQFPKRQIELVIDKLATKEKREGDTAKVWHLHDEYVSLASAASETAAALVGSGKKRAREDSGGDEMADMGSPSLLSPNSKQPREPRKFKRAFGFFVKEKRAEAEELLGADAEVRSYCYEAC